MYHFIFTFITSDVSNFFLLSLFANSVLLYFIAQTQTMACPSTEHASFHTVSWETFDGETFHADLP